MERRFPDTVSTVGGAFYLKQWRSYNISIWDTAGEGGHRSGARRPGAPRREISIPQGRAPQGRAGLPPGLGPRAQGPALHCV